MSARWNTQWRIFVQVGFVTSVHSLHNPQARRPTFRTKEFGEMLRRGWNCCEFKPHSTQARQTLIINSFAFVPKGLTRMLQGDARARRVKREASSERLVCRLCCSTLQLDNTFTFGRQGMGFATTALPAWFQGYWVMLFMVARFHFALLYT